MTYRPAQFTCDVCTEPVEERELVALQLRAGEGASVRLADGGTARACWLAHFHQECLDEVYDALVTSARPAEYARPVPRPKRTRTDRPLKQVTDTRHLLWPLPTRDELNGLCDARSRDGGVSHMRISGRSFNAIWRNTRVCTAAELATLTDSELLSIKGIGRHGLAEIRAALAADTADTAKPENRPRLTVVAS